MPRPPQGQPLVVALAHSQVPWEFAARSADVVLVTPADEDDVAVWVGNVRRASDIVERRGPPLVVMVDLEVHLDPEPGAAAARKASLDSLDGRPQRSDAAIFTGTPAELADLLLAWQAHGVVGFRLRPAVLPLDLDQLVDGLVPELQRRGAFRTSYDEPTLRARFGFSRPVSRYSGAST